MNDASKATGIPVAWLIFLAVGAVLLVLVIPVAVSDSFSSSRQRRDEKARRAAIQVVERQTRDREITSAFALAVKTENFSHDACRAAAATNREKILAAHAEVEAKEAVRLATARARAAHYEEVAAYAAPKSELGHAAIVDILRNADEWEYQVLQEAKKLAVEEAK